MTLQPVCTPHRIRSAGFRALAAACTILFIGPPPFPGGTAPASSTPAVASEPQLPPDLDDHLADPAYARFAQQKLRWSRQACPSYARSGVCATVTAPLNWASPTQGTIRLGLFSTTAPVPRTAPPRLLLSHGGGPRSTQLFYGRWVAQKVGLSISHLVIGVDARGAGMATSPSCSRSPGVPQDTASLSAPALAAHYRAVTRHFTECAAQKSSVLPYLSSDQVVRDLNLVRHVLGYRTTDYYGTSYGSLLGVTARQMFPSRFERVVLDSVVDWTVPLRRSSVDAQVEGLEMALREGWAPWVARHHETYRLGQTAPDVLARLTAVRKKVAAGRSQMTPRQLDFTITAAMNSAERWGALARALRELQHTRSRMLMPWDRKDDDADEAAPHSGATPRIGRTRWVDYTSRWLRDRPGANPWVLRATMCNDTGSWGSAEDEAIRALARARAHPLAGTRNLTFSCADWPRPAALTSELRHRSIGDVLMLQKSHDPTTPADRVLGVLPSASRLVGDVVSRPPARSATELAAATVGDGSRLVFIREGHGHGTLTNPCTREAARSYLTTGLLPTTGLVCQPVPLPHDAVDDDATGDTES